MGEGVIRMLRKRDGKPCSGCGLHRPALGSQQSCVDMRSEVKVEKEKEGYWHWCEGCDA